MKLSTVLAAMLDAKADHEMIRRTILDYEAEQLDGLNKRRENDAKRQAEKRKRDDNHVMSRDVTVTVPSHASASPAPDLENKQTNKQENKKTSRASDGAAFRAELASDLPPELLEGIIKVRRDKRGQVTGLSARYFREDAAKCGMSIHDAAKACVTSSWITVKPEYFQRRGGAPPQAGVVGAAQRIWEGKQSGSESIFGGNSDVKRLSSGGGVERGSAPEDVRSGIGRQFAGSGG